MSGRRSRRGWIESFSGRADACWVFLSSSYGKAYSIGLESQENPVSNFKFPLTSMLILILLHSNLCPLTVLRNLYDSRLLPEMTLCRGYIGTFRLGHRAPFNKRSSYFAFLGTNSQASATAFLRAPSLISVALLVRAAIPSLVRMLPELVRQHQVSRWLFHQTWLCSPYCSIMGDISYAVFVDSHRIPSSLLFLCGFLYRDPAGTYYLGSSVRLRLACVSKFNAQAAQKPYSSTGAGLVLRGSHSKWYQEGAIVTARHRNRLSRQLPSQPVSKQVIVSQQAGPFLPVRGDVVVPSVFFMEGSLIQDILERRIDKCDEEMEIPEKSTNKSNMAMNVSVLSGPYFLMTDLHSQLMTLNDLRTLGGQACLRLGCFAVAWGITVRRDRRAPHTAMPTAAFESIFGVIFDQPMQREWDIE
ncbi:hypothetical protein LXL04_039961 [Taraxacum kok-saghyz]